MALREARRVLPVADPLQAELWASRWLGQAWSTAGDPELVREIAQRAAETPSAEIRAAVEALLLVCPATVRAPLVEAVPQLADQVPPSWRETLTLSSSPQECREAPGVPVVEPSDQGTADGAIFRVPWVARAAWRIRQGTGEGRSPRAWMVRFSGPSPHTVVASVLDPGPGHLDTLRVLGPDAAHEWSRDRSLARSSRDLVPMPPAEALAGIAAALDVTDRAPFRPDEPGVVAHRALAWSRCRWHGAQAAPGDTPSGRGDEPPTGPRRLDP